MGKSPKSLFDMPKQPVFSLPEPSETIYITSLYDVSVRDDDTFMNIVQPGTELSDLRSCTSPLEARAEPPTAVNLEPKDPSRQSFLSDIKIKMDEDSLEHKRSGG